MNANIIMFIFMVLYLLIDIFCISNYKKKIKQLQEENKKLEKQLNLSV